MSLILTGCILYSIINRYPALSHQLAILKSNYICRSKLIIQIIHNIWNVNWRHRILHSTESLSSLEEIVPRIHTTAPVVNSLLNSEFLRSRYRFCRNLISANMMTSSNGIIFVCVCWGGGIHLSPVSKPLGFFCKLSSRKILLDWLGLAY